MIILFLTTKEKVMDLWCSVTVLRIFFVNIFEHIPAASNFTASTAPKMIILFLTTKEKVMDLWCSVTVLRIFFVNIFEHIPAASNFTASTAPKMIILFLTTKEKVMDLWCSVTVLRIFFVNKISSESVRMRFQNDRQKESEKSQKFSQKAASHLGLLCLLTGISCKNGIKSHLFSQKVKTSLCLIDRYYWLNDVRVFKRVKCVLNKPFFCVFICLFMHGFRFLCISFSLT